MKKEASTSSFHLKTVQPGLLEKSNLLDQSLSLDGSFLMPRLHIYVSIAVLLLTLAPFAPGADWTQYRGTYNNGTSSDRILKQWPTNGPGRLWQVDFNNSYSTFTVSRQRVFTLDMRRVTNQYHHLCLALDANSGKELWAAIVGIKSYQNPPQSTPAVDGNLVFVLSNDIVLFCLDAQTGQLIWKKDLVTEYNASALVGSSAASPAIDGDLVFVNCSGNFASSRAIALHKATGDLAWQAVAGHAGYATPIPTTIHGIRQVLFLTQSGLVSAARNSGEILWKYVATMSPFASPLAIEDKVFFYDNQALWLIQVIPTETGFSSKLIWKSLHESTGYAWSTPVWRDNCIYLLDGYNSLESRLRCLSLATGKDMWAQKGYATGGLILANEDLLVLNNTGELVLVATDPGGYTEKGRFQALSRQIPGGIFNHPALCNGRIYVRGSGEGACFDIAALPQATPFTLSHLTAPSGGKVHLSATIKDGSPLSPQRLQNLEIWTTSYLGTPLSNWFRLTNMTCQSNGLIQLTLPGPKIPPQSIFIGVEKP